MKKNIRYLSLFLVIGLLLSWPIHTLYTKLERPDEEKKLLEMDRLADDLLDHVRKGDLARAQERIEQLAERFPRQSLPLPIRIESLNAVTQSILAVRQSIQSPHMNEEQLLWDATRVRVAIDALIHHHQPLWKNYYTAFFMQMQNLQKSAVERDFKTFHEQFEDNHRLFLVIKPAMSIQLSESTLKEISSAYERISKEMRSSEKDWQLVRESLRELNSLMQTAFVGEDTGAFVRLMMRPDSPVLITCSIVIALLLSLTYVAYRKYQAEFSTR